MFLDQNEKNYICAGYSEREKKDLFFTHKEIIEEVERQKAQGIKPAYCFYNHKTGENITPPGWLVWSLWERGAGVVYEREDGQKILVTGWQSDFCLA